MRVAAVSNSFRATLQKWTILGGNIFALYGIFTVVELSPCQGQERVIFMVYVPKPSSDATRRRCRPTCAPHLNHATNLVHFEWTKSPSGLLISLLVEWKFLVRTNGKQYLKRRHLHFVVRTLATPWPSRTTSDVCVSTVRTQQSLSAC